MLRHGYPYRAIAAQLSISIQTIDKAVFNLKLKLGVRSRPEMICRALELDWVPVTFPTSDR